jgi:hypothetical protein
LYGDCVACEELTVEAGFDALTVAVINVAIFWSKAPNIWQHSLLKLPRELVRVGRVYHHGEFGTNVILNAAAICEAYHHGGVSSRVKYIR